MPISDSDASRVQSRGLGLTHVSLVERNEFTVDCGQAGSNMLLVGVLGQRGPCEEVVVRHLGRGIHRVTYRVCDPGDYILVVKWGSSMYRIPVQLKCGLAVESKCACINQLTLMGRYCHPSASLLNGILRSFSGRFRPT